MKKRFLMLCLATGIVATVSLSGCGKKEDEGGTQVVQSTEDQFAINQDVQVMGNSGNSSGGSNTGSGNAGGEDTYNDNSNDMTMANDNRTEWEVQESENAYLDESVAVEESEEYESYINSEEREEVVMVYDRTENGVLVFKNSESVDDVTGETISSTEEYRVNSADVTEGVEELSQGDLATIVTNMALDYDTNTFIKVWEVKNLTKEMESLSAEDAADDEDHGELDVEDLEDEDGLTVETTEEEVE